MEKQYPKLNRKKFLQSLEPFYRPSEMEKIGAAYAFSKWGHMNQWRDDRRVRYFEHPRAVAWILAVELEIVDWQLITEALLHDIIEDSYLLSEKRLEINFGSRVALDVKHLTKEAGVNYVSRLRDHGTWRALMVKLADRLHNLRTVDAVSPEKRIRKLEETRTDYLPLAEVLIKRTPSRHQPKASTLVTAIEDLVPVKKV